MTLDEYQEFIWKWHRTKFPGATEHKILGKAMEELGEVAEVVNKHLGSDKLVEEVGDVLNVLASLLAVNGRNLTEAMEYGMTVPYLKGWDGG